MSEIRLSILLDNNTLIDQYFLGEPGFAAFLEINGQKILFDTGYSDAYLQNAQKLGIDLLTADTIIFSHGHIDHTWGLLPLIRALTERDFAFDGDVLPSKQKLIGHPHAFLEKSGAPVPRQIGSLFSLNSLQSLFDVEMAKEPRWLNEHVLYLGEIPRKTAFEPSYALGETVDGPDYLLDDTALAVVTDEGLIILTGCSHAGICNIVQYAQKLTGEARIRDIVGGFHLLDPSEERLTGTVDFLAQVQPKALHACHCTDLRSKVALAEQLPLHEVGSGLVLTYD